MLWLSSVLFKEIGKRRARLVPAGRLIRLVHHSHLAILDFQRPPITVAANREFLRFAHRRSNLLRSLSEMFCPERRLPLRKAMPPQAQSRTIRLAAAPHCLLQTAQ